jgi:hypothetical protein
MKYLASFQVLLCWSLTLRNLGVSAMDLCSALRSILQQQMAQIQASIDSQFAIINQRISNVDSRLAQVQSCAAVQSSSKMGSSLSGSAICRICCRDSLGPSTPAASAATAGCILSCSDLRRLCIRRSRCAVDLRHNGRFGPRFDELFYFKAIGVCHARHRLWL